MGVHLPAPTSYVQLIPKAPGPIPVQKNTITCNCFVITHTRFIQPEKCLVFMVWCKFKIVLVRKTMPHNLCEARKLEIKAFFSPFYSKSWLHLDLQAFVTINKMLVFTVAVHMWNLNGFSQCFDLDSSITQRLCTLCQSYWHRAVRILICTGSGRRPDS